MNDDRVGYLTSEQLLFLSPWKPLEKDTSPLEGRSWICPNCEEQRTYFRSITRLEGGKNQYLLQCPTCDHLTVVRMGFEGDAEIITLYGGPHIDHFLRFLDQRSLEDGD